MLRDREELDVLRRSMGRVMEDFGPDYWRELDAGRGFPTGFFEVAAKAELFGTMIPREHGGTGAGPAAASVIVEEINRTGGDAAAINAQMSICGSLLRAGSDEQRARYLPSIASGAVRCLSVAATETDSGADMSSLSSVARRSGGGWVLNANKVFISMAEHTRLLILLVKTDEGPTLFVLDLEEIDDGIEVRPLDMVTNRMTTTLFIDELSVPDAARLGPVGDGLKILGGGFAVRRSLAAAELIGNCRFLLDLSIEHAKTRQVFDRPIGQNQGVQYPLAWAYAKLEAADLMRWDALGLIEAGADGGDRSALARLLASDAATDTTQAAITTFGGWALASEMHVERKLRENTVFLFNNMLLSLVSQRVLGLPKAF